MWHINSINVCRQVWLTCMRHLVFHWTNPTHSLVFGWQLTGMLYCASFLLPNAKWFGCLLWIMFHSLMSPFDAQIKPGWHIVFFSCSTNRWSNVGVQNEVSGCLPKQNTCSVKKHRKNTVLGLWDPYMFIPFLPNKLRWYPQQPTPKPPGAFSGTFSGTSPEPYWT